MPPEMSSLSQRCILQYVEANKRIHVASRCRAIKQTEKSIPLYLENLVFWGNTLRMNNVKYSIMKYKISSEKEPRLQEYISIDFEKENSIDHSKRNRIAMNIETSEATKILIDQLLGGRHLIHVNNLSFPWSGIDISHLPTDLKLRPRKMDVGFAQLKKYLPIIDESSFPLEQLMLQYESSESFGHSVTQTAQKLVITDFDFLFFTWVDELKNLPNKNVIINLSMSPSVADISGIIQNWNSSEKDIGMCYTVKNYEDREWTVEVVDEIREEFNGNFVELSMPGVRYNECIMIPINKTCEFVIFGFTISDPEYTFPIRAISMRVIPVGFTLPVD